MVIYVRTRLIKLKHIQELINLSGRTDGNLSSIQASRNRCEYPMHSSTAMIAFFVVVDVHIKYVPLSVCYFNSYTLFILPWGGCGGGILCFF